MAKRWYGLRKVTEECGELIVELMKLQAFPNGKHPGRKKSVIISTEEECADVLAAVEFFIDRNKLDRESIERRKALKYKKFSRWWPFDKPKKNKKKSAAKVVALGEITRSNASLHVETSKNAPKRAQ